MTTTLTSDMLGAQENSPRGRQVSATTALKEKYLAPRCARRTDLQGPSTSVSRHNLGIHCTSILEDRPAILEDRPAASLVNNRSSVESSVFPAIGIAFVTVGSR